MNKKQLIEHIDKKYDNNDEILCIFWNESDVKLREDELKIPLTLEQRKEVLKQINKNNTATTGVNWDTIDYYIHKINNESINKK